MDQIHGNGPSMDKYDVFYMSLRPWENNTAMNYEQNVYIKQPTHSRTPSPRRGENGGEGTATRRITSNGTHVQKLFLLCETKNDSQ